MIVCFIFFFSSRRRHTRCSRDWSSDVCSSDLCGAAPRAVPRQSECGPERVAGALLERPPRRDRERGVEGKRVELWGGRVIIKKKKTDQRHSTCDYKAAAHLYRCPRDLVTIRTD